MLILLLSIYRRIAIYVSRLTKTSPFCYKWLYCFSKHSSPWFCTGKAIFVTFVPFWLRYLQNIVFRMYGSSGIQNCWPRSLFLMVGNKTEVIRFQIRTIWSILHLFNILTSQILSCFNQCVRAMSPVGFPCVIRDFWHSNDCVPLKNCGSYITINNKNHQTVFFKVLFVRTLFDWFGSSYTVDCFSISLHTHIRGMSRK